MTDPDVPLLKPNEVARRLGVSRSWVYEASRAGRIPCVRLGGPDGPVRFVPEDVGRWLEQAGLGWASGRRAATARARASRLAPRPATGAGPSVRIALGQPLAARSHAARRKAADAISASVCAA